MNIKELSTNDLPEIKELFRAVFAGPPWNEDWNDENQLDEYMKDLTEVRNSLIFGLYEDGRFIGVSVGKIKHWCEGTEYFIEELCIRNEYQGKGFGKGFMNLIQDKVKERGVNTIYLMTDRNQPAYEFYKRIGFEELPQLTSFYKDF